MKWINKRIYDYAESFFVAEVDGDDDDIPDPIPENPIIPTPGTGNDRATYYSEYEYSSQIRVSPLVAYASSWNQDERFSDFCPMVRDKVHGGHKHGYCGCVPLAIAMILGHERNMTISYEGISVDWDVIRGNSDSDNFKNHASALVRKIGEECMSMYFTEGTFTFPSFAAMYLRRLGFSSANYDYYNTIAVVRSLNAGRPVFVSSIPESGISKSHAWTIDGYMENLRTEIKYRTYLFVTEEYSRTTSVTGYMVHCNYGWGGSYNGWYASGVFDMKSGNNIYDNPESIYDDPENPEDDPENYNRYIKTITY